MNNNECGSVDGEYGFGSIKREDYGFEYFVWLIENGAKEIHCSNGKVLKVTEEVKEFFTTKTKIPLEYDGYRFEMLADHSYKGE